MADLHCIAMSMHHTCVTKMLGLPKSVTVILVPRIDGQIDIRLMSPEPFHVNNVPSSSRGEGWIGGMLGDAVRLRHGVTGD